MANPPARTAAAGAAPGGTAAGSSAPGSAAPAASFEAALAELEALVQKMEAGALSLEDSLQAYRRGAELVSYCRDTLARVQQQVRILEGDLLKPFDAEAGTDP
jgi:exodeoxyribonuclease VII small subunit